MEGLASWPETLFPLQRSFEPLVIVYWKGLVLVRSMWLENVATGIFWVEMKFG